jgi:hypothetical protein
MPSSHSSSPVKIGKRKVVSSSIFNKNQKIYVHFNEKSGTKSITFSEKEYKILMKKVPEIQRGIKKLQKKLKKNTVVDESDGDTSNNDTPMEASDSE